MDDLKKVALKLGKEKITYSEYKENGKYGITTFERRFGNWSNALEKGGLQISFQQKNISDEELFENMEDVWIKLGRQPRSPEIKQPLSKYSSYHYTKRFGAWRKALEAFIVFINSDEVQNSEKGETDLQLNNFKIIPEKEIIKHKTKRSISSRLKV